MSKRPLTAGDDVEARCTRCREVTNHTVVALVEGRVARVQCHICDGVHNYHAPAATRTPRPPAPKPVARAPRPRRNSAAAELAEWEEVTGPAEKDTALPYAMNLRCRAGDLLRHPVFGLGVVKVLVPPGKMEVLFQMGKKLLRCG